jgi:hypothetical protein
MPIGRLQSQEPRGFRYIPTILYLELTPRFRSAN